MVKEKWPEWLGDEPDVIGNYRFVSEDIWQSLLQEFWLYYYQQEDFLHDQTSNW
jgi:hypothetical protein